MRRTIIENPVSPGVVRYRIVLQDEVETDPGTHDAMVRQYEVIRTIHETPHLLACGFQPWDKLSIWHDGVRWTVEVEAILQVKLTPDSGDPTVKMPEG